MFRYGNLNSNGFRSESRLARQARIAGHFVVDVGFLKQISELRMQLSSERLVVQRFPPTYVPGRNTVFLGIAAYYAEVHGSRYIMTGHIDRDPFPDSEPAYIRAMNTILSQGNWLRRKERITIVVPFARKRKQDVTRLGADLEVPFDLT